VKIVACIGFSDEGSLLFDCVGHMFSIGVDAVIVGHMSRSEADSARLRTQFDGRTDVALLQFRQTDAKAFEYPQAMLACAQRHFAPDWLLFGDADEFWIPRGGSLRALLDSARYDVLQVPRFNLALEGGLDGPVARDLRHPEGPLMFVGGPANKPELMAGAPDHRWIAGGVHRKVLARAAMTAQLTLGMHDVVPPPGTEPLRAVASDLVIAHLPFTTLERFRCKVQGIREIFRYHGHRLNANDAWHWRRWLELEDAGRLDEEFRHQVLAPETLEQWRAEGLLQTPEQYFTAVAALGGTVRSG
jgi:hypothetical protein